MVRIIECLEAHYEIKEVDFGMVYRWRPECVVISCDCGESLTLTSSATTCGCGADHAAVVQEQLGGTRLEDEVIHPWRYTGDRETIGLPC